MEIFGIILTLFSFFGIQASPSIKTPPPPPAIEEAPVPGAYYPEEIEAEPLAKCLTEKGVKFYGAFWCGHCDDQKKMFGDAMQYIEYVECDSKGENPQVEACMEEGITAYPTWVFPDGEKLVGTQQFKDLAYASGC